MIELCVGHGMQRMSTYSLNEYSICKQRRNQVNTSTRSTILQACAELETATALDFHQVEGCGGAEICPTDGLSTQVCDPDDAITCYKNLEHQAANERNSSKGLAFPPVARIHSPLHPVNHMWMKSDKVRTKA